MSNTIELLHLDAIKRAKKDTLYKVQPSIEYSLCYTHAGVTKQIAIEFAEWCVTNANPIFPNRGIWNLTDNHKLEISTVELFQEFLKSKEIKLPDLTWKDASEEELKSKELKSMKGKRL